MRIILDHCARPALEDGPPYNAAASLFGLARYPNVYLKLTPRIFAECRRGQGDAGNVFSAPGRPNSAPSRLAWGSNYPSSEGKLPELLAVARESLACLPQADQEWIFARTAQVLYPALAD